MDYLQIQINYQGPERIKMDFQKQTSVYTCTGSQGQLQGCLT